MKNKMKQYRHGDLLIVPVDSVPKGAKVDKARVLAYGEVTGHAHRLDKGAVMFKDEQDNAFFRVKHAARLTHEEHGPILFEPGDYRVIRQREYSPQGNRGVID